MDKQKRSHKAMPAGQIYIGATKLGNARMRCRNHGMMPCWHIGRARLGGRPSV